MKIYVLPLKDLEYEPDLRFLSIDFSTGELRTDWGAYLSSLEADPEVTTAELQK